MRFIYFWFAVPTSITASSHYLGDLHYVSLVNTKRFKYLRIWRGNKKFTIGDNEVKLRPDCTRGSFAPKRKLLQKLRSKHASYSDQIETYLLMSWRAKNAVRNI